MILDWCQNLIVNGNTKTCPVCGEKTVFTGFTDNLRESGNCGKCGSFNRQRQLAHAIRTHLGMSPRGPLSFDKTFTIYNLESNGALHHALSKHSKYNSSEYFGPEYKAGEMVRGIRNENLANLSFSNESFDLVLSSDVLEHMPDPYLGHREIWRVLKPGGVHLFTVPFSGAKHDDIRAKIESGSTVYLKEPLYHGDPVRPGEGILVWTIFGEEMLQNLESIGFRAKKLVLSLPQHGIIGDNCLVFSAQKPLSTI